MKKIIKDIYKLSLGKLNRQSTLLLADEPFTLYFSIKDKLNQKTIKLQELINIGFKNKDMLS